VNNLIKRDNPVFRHSPYFLKIDRKDWGMPDAEAVPVPAAEVA
jgi:hypothetical protein